MKVNIVSSTLVPPSSETPQVVLWNSNMDLACSGIHVEIFFVFKPNGSPDFFSTDIVREAIAKSLVLYYPMAGRLQRDKNGRMEINCRGQGILFTEAEAEADIDELGNFAPRPCILEIIPKVEITEDIESVPLYLFQITRFKCGAVSLGIAMHHILADGLVGMHFINSIAEHAKGLPVSSFPYIDRTLLRARNPPTPKFSHVEYLPAPSLLHPTKGTSGKNETGVANGHGNHNGIANAAANGHRNDIGIANGDANGLSNDNEIAHGVVNGHSDDNGKANGVANSHSRHNEIAKKSPAMEVDMLVLSKEKLAILKQKGIHKDNEVSYTTYEMLSAHIWKCLTMARGLGGPQPSKLYIAADGRTRLVPPLPQSYYGNVIFTATPMSTAEELVSKPLFHTARLIHESLARMDDEYLRSALDFLELRLEPNKPMITGRANGSAIERYHNAFETPNLRINSWARLPVYEFDLGWGKPIFMGPARIHVDAKIYLLASPTNDGSLIISLGLTDNTMPKFRELYLNVEDAF